VRRKSVLLVLALAVIASAAWAQAIGTITTVAGGGPNNLPATASSIDGNYAVALDALGNVYIPDVGACAVYKVDTTGLLTIVAGQPAVCGFSGDGGPATSALLNRPTAVAVDGSGNIFISDILNERIRRVDGATRTITTYAGSGIAGYNGDNQPATSASLNLTPQGNTSAFYDAVAVDSSGNLYIADSFNNRVRIVDFTTQTINTYAGIGTPGFFGDFGPATSAELNGPRGLAIDPTGGLYIADFGNSRVRFVDSNVRNIHTVIGTGTNGFNGDNMAGVSTEINAAEGVGVDGAGNFYVADRMNNRIRTTSPASGLIVTVAGNGTAGFSGDGGSAVSAQLNSPVGVTADAMGNLFIGDTNNLRVRRVDSQTTVISEFAGNGFCCFSGDGHPATDAAIIGAGDVFSDPQGNFFIADLGNSAVREVAASTGQIQTVAGNPALGPGFSGDGGPATSARINTPGAVEVDSAGDLFILDFSNNVIREVTGGVIHTVAGIAGQGGQGYSGDGGPATSAQLDFANGIGLDSAGNLYIADSNNNVVRKVTVATGVIETVAGNHALGAGVGGDGGPATSAQLNFPSAVKVDAAGNIFIADSNNNAIREVLVATGNIQTIAGELGADGGFGGDNGPATSALLNFPVGLTLDAAGNVFIADFNNNVVREVTAATGIIQTVAGMADFAAGFSGDGGPATSAQLHGPGGASVDPMANLLIADLNNSRVRSLKGIASQGLAVVSLPASVPFGNIGQFVSGSMTVTLTNTGQASLGFSTPPAITGANAADFVITDATCVVGTPVAPNNGTCVVEVTFTPSTAVLETASLVFMDNAVPSSQTVPLTGTGVAPQVTTSPVSPFGSQPVNTTSAAQTVRVSVANGTGTLQLTSITIAGANAADFAIGNTSTCPLTGGSILGDDDCTIIVTFTPVAVGARAATLNIAGSNLPGSPIMLSLTGTGTAAPAPVVSISTTSLLFGVVPVGTPSAPMSVTVTNTGNAQLTFSAPPAISGTNAADFRITASTCPTEGGVAPNGTCVVTVVFTPTVPTPEQATLTLTNNAASSPQTVPLSGGGPGFTLTATSATGGPGTTVTVLPGDTGVFTLLLTCAPGVTGTVTLALAGSLPPSTILTISPQTIQCPSTGPVAVMLTLQTNCVPSLVAPGNPWQTPRPGPMGMMLLSVSSAALLLFALRRRTLPAGSWQRVVLAGLALFLLVGTFTACVSNDPPAIPNAPTTPAGTYQLAIVGTGPTGAKSTLMLTVRVI